MKALMHHPKCSLFITGLALAFMMNRSHRQPAAAAHAGDSAPHRQVSQPSSQPAMRPDLAGYTPTEQLDSGRVGLTAADVAFYLRVVAKAVRDAKAASSPLSPQPEIANVKTLSQQEVAALKAHEMARFQQLERQAAAADQALKTKMHAAAFSVQEAGKLGMPAGQWHALCLGVGGVAQGLDEWQSGVALNRLTGTKSLPYCPPHQLPGLSAHLRYTARDFAILHAACLADQAAVLPNLRSIIRLNNAYIAAMKKRGAHTFHVSPMISLGGAHRNGRKGEP